MARTEEEMKAILADKMWVGQKVRFEKWSLAQDENGGAKHREIRRGFVTGLYPHIFTVEFKGRTEAFRYSEVFQTVGERVVLSW